MKNDQHPVIALFFDRTYVDAHPCFREMIVSLLAREWQVDLFVEYSETHPLPVIHSPCLRIFPFQKNRWDLALTLLRLFFRGWRRYKWMVATPKWALYWSVQIGRCINVPVVCLSDEVYPWDEERTSHERKWKRREMWAHQRAKLTVSLSEARFELVRKENRLAADHPHVVVPNSPPGPAFRQASSYYRDRFGIPSHKGILLHSGNFQWLLARRLAVEARRWNGRWVVVFQFRYPDASEALEPGENIHFSKTIIPTDLMPYVTSSADVGLALYDRENTRDVRNGETPGKLGLYLGCSLPVICGNIDSLRWVEDEGCGIWFKTLEEIPAAADTIRSNYSSYANNAARVFSQRFDYSRAFERFYELLKGVA